jgi:two-component system, LytTR family, response regulator
VLIPLRDIDWCEAEDNYVRIHTARKRHLVRATMRAIGEQLGDRWFARVHRSAIVNLSRIAEIRPQLSGDYRVVLTDGTRLALSRTYRDALLERFQS